MMGMLVVASIGSTQVLGREASVGTIVERREAVEKIKSKGSSTTSIDFSKCKSKKDGFCGYQSRVEKNSTLEDKRVVPTGPNPLHNR